MSTRRARVVVAYATVKVLNPATGKWAMFGYHRDAVLPDEADPDNVASLVRRGYAEWVDAAEPTVAQAEPEKEPDPDKDAESEPSKEAEAPAAPAKAATPRARA